MKVEYYYYYYCVTLVFHHEKATFKIPNTSINVINGQHSLPPAGEVLPENPEGADGS